MNLEKLILILITAAVSLSAFALDDRALEIADRLVPVGTICMAGDPCSASGGASSDGDDSRDPEQVYNTYCLACHTTGVGGAPVLGDVAAWADRLSKGRDELYQNAIDGLNAMPAMGVCMDCSPDDIVATVDYILERSQ